MVWVGLCVRGCDFVVLDVVFVDLILGVDCGLCPCVDACGLDALYVVVVLLDDIVYLYGDVRVVLYLL